MSEWKPSATQQDILAKLKIGDDIKAITKVADDLLAQHLTHNSNRLALKEAENAVEWAENEVILSGTVTGKNEAERKAQLIKLLHTDKAYQEALYVQLQLEATLATSGAWIAGLEAKAVALRMAITGKASMLSFLGSTSN